MSASIPGDGDVRRYAFAMEAASIGAWDWDLLTGQVWWSDNLGEILGVERDPSKETLDGFLHVVHPEDRDRVRAAISQTVETGEDYLAEFRIIGSDGRTRWIQGKGRVIRDEAGQAIRLLGISTDVTARREAEDARSLLAAIVESSTDAIVVRSLDGIIMSWNPAAERLYGYKAEEMIGRPIDSLIPPDRHHEFEENLEQVRRGERAPAYETVRLRSDGTLIPVSVSVSPIIDESGRILGAATITRDDTERRRAAERLQLLAEASRIFAEKTHDLESTLRAIAAQLVRVIGDGCIMRLLSDDGQWLLPAAVEYADPAATEYTRRMLAAVAHRADEGVNGQVAQTGEPVFLPEVEPATLMAQLRPEYREHVARFPTFGLMVVPLRARGRVIGTVGLSRLQPGRPYTRADLTLLQQLADHAGLAVDNARLLNDAQRAERRYRTLFESIADPIVVFDPTLRFLDANPAALALLGWSWEELSELRLPALLVAAETEVLEECSQLRRDGRWHGEVELRRRDGTTVPVEVIVTAAELSGETVYLASCRDITERRLLRHLQEDFLAMVSHDLRGPLTVIRANADLLRLRRTFEERTVRTILSQVDRMDRLIEDLASVVQVETGGLELNREPVDLPALIRQEVELIESRTDRHTVRIETPPGPVVSACDSKRLAQVLQNLLENAVKYSPAGGEIVVRLEESETEITISITDCGVGIAPQDIPRLFERYYRAGDGEQASGLGLGLYIARMIVEAHGGRIWAESTLGQGSTFTVALPRG